MRRAVAVAATLAALGAGCAAGDDAIVVGAVYPTGGSQGEGGREEYRGVILATQLANDRGGVGGRDLRVELRPVESADQAPAAVESLVDEGAAVIVGSYGSTVSRPAANAAARLRTVFWETGAVGDLGMRADPGRYVFRVPPSGGVLGRRAVAFVRDRLGPELGGPPMRFAVAYVDDVYGRAVARGASAEIEARGGRVLAQLPYDLPDADYRAIARRVKASGADALFVVAYLDDGVAIRRALLTEDVPLRTTIGTSSSYCHPAFGEILGDDAVGVFASDKPDGDVLDPAVLRPDAAQALVWARRIYRERFGEPMPAPALAGFAGAWALFRHVLPRASALEPDAIAAAAQRVDVPDGGLPNGSGLRFAPPGGADAGANLRAASVIWEWVAARQRAVVWPPAYATHPLRPPAS